jgi:hypothetical protein
MNSTAKVQMMSDRMTKSVPGIFSFDIGHSTLDILRFAFRILRKLQISRRLCLWHDAEKDPARMLLKSAQIQGARNPEE